jgi:membrane-associated protease RseP (regulator of RpoE activity)
MRTFLSAFVAVAFLSVGTLYAQQPGALGVTMGKNLTGGALVANVVADSPADRIGLQSGDRILAINGQPTANYHDVTRIIGAMHANDRVELTVARGGWQGKLTGELGAVATVFNPARQFVPASSPVNLAPAAPQDASDFPFDFFDNGSRSAAAAYGGGGY